MADSNGVVVTKLEGRGPLNLLGRETFLGLKAVLDRLDQDRSVRAMILTGSGERAFSAGVDLHQMKDLDPADAEEFITALHGPAVGMGRSVSSYPSISSDLTRHLI